MLLLGQFQGMTRKTRRKPAKFEKTAENRWMSQVEGIAELIRERRDSRL